MKPQTIWVPPEIKHEWLAIKVRSDIMQSVKEIKSDLRDLNAFCEMLLFIQILLVEYALNS